MLVKLASLNRSGQISDKFNKLRVHYMIQNSFQLHRGQSNFKHVVRDPKTALTCKKSFRGETEANLKRILNAFKTRGKRVTRLIFFFFSLITCFESNFSIRSFVFIAAILFSNYPKKNLRKLQSYSLHLDRSKLNNAPILFSLFLINSIEISSLTLINF